MNMKNVKVIDGKKVYVLPKYSRFSEHNIDSIEDKDLWYTYTYQREPIPGNRTIYADVPAAYVELRDDVIISGEDANGDVYVTWERYTPCPIMWRGKWYSN